MPPFRQRYTAEITGLLVWLIVMSLEITSRQVRQRKIQHNIEGIRRLIDLQGRLVILSRLTGIHQLKFDSVSIVIVVPA